MRIVLILALVPKCPLPILTVSHDSLRFLVYESIKDFKDLHVN